MLLTSRLVCRTGFFRQPTQLKQVDYLLRLQTRLVTSIEGETDNLEDEIFFNSIIGGHKFRQRQKKIDKMIKAESTKKTADKFSTGVSQAFISPECRANLLGEHSIQSEQIALDDTSRLVEEIKFLRQQKLEYFKTLETNLEASYLDFMNSSSSNPNVPASNVPCGGCGAPLHCQDPNYPGFIPAECFRGVSVHYLRGQICQRCYNLKNYKKALHVDVSPEDYPEILKQIKDKRALVMLVVDLLDFPCSIWPHLSEIIGKDRPICLVGNKVDLLPNDGKFFLDRIKDSLVHEVFKATEIRKNCIRHVALVSAKTGFGIEQLINKLHRNWKVQGDVYVVGCTNVGKSSLFNALLDSDYCKVQASDKVQRATISNFPGTTLNLLKFPIMRPNHKMLYERTIRIINERIEENLETHNQKEMLRETRDLEHATLRGKVGKTYELNTLELDDPFKLPTRRPAGFAPEAGIDPNEDAYACSRWCYDTPGVVFPEQVINILTTEELEKVIPKSIISPRSFSLMAGQTLFLAGLGRVDYLEGNSDQIILTIFSSPHLPVTICNTRSADQIYKTYLGSEVLQVPFGTEERLSIWPGLKQGLRSTFTGIGRMESVADVLFSSAGWASITIPKERVAELEFYTPMGLGIHVRKPSMLCYAVTRRGRRIERTPTYEKYRPVLSK
ncbi:nitric oxide-associated protein 1 [Neocloeon triangulifer]|uniref:nitric oxide-associated protein 1 n=1 Tax=Neocloeon triangulifer TaxID=2078957 RepID=UPI00286F9542|nr:nitric oxide-associated protein 1 [Neocloeon triangulifer]